MATAVLVKYSVRMAEMKSPIPPWRTPAKKAPARQPLTQDAIVEAALRVLDSEGLDAVSMRRVAQELGAGAASLYVHVANKDELFELVLDRVYGEIEIPEPSAERWRDQVIALASNSRDVLRRHPGIARVAMFGAPTGVNGLRLAEGYIGILRAAGLPKKIVAGAIDRIGLYVTSDVFEGTLYAAKGFTSGDDPKVKEYWEQIGSYYRSLPADQFPGMTDMLDELLEGDDDERFLFGLELMLDGLASHLPR